MSCKKYRFEPILIFPIWWSSFDTNCWNCFSREKCWLNYLTGEKYRLNYRGEKNIWKKMVKYEYEPILVFYIWWSSFNPNCWNCLVKSQLNCLSSKKCSLNYCGGDKCWRNNRNLGSNRILISFKPLKSICILNFNWSYYQEENKLSIFSKRKSFSSIGGKIIFLKNNFSFFIVTNNEKLKNYFMGKSSPLSPTKHYLSVISQVWSRNDFKICNYYSYLQMCTFLLRRHSEKLYI